MGAQSAANSGKRSWLKLFLFGIGCLVVLLFVAGIALFAQFGSHIFVARWMPQLHQGMELYKSDSEKGKLMIDKTFSDAAAANAPVATLMSLHREYAHFLYNQDEKEDGDAQIESAISLCKSDPAPNSAEADQLTHAYQDRGWDSHMRFLRDPSKPSGDKDQEMSVAVCEKAFGPDHEQTIYKIPSLAVIYADMNLTDKAEKAMQRAVTATDTKASAKECGWFVYALLARMKAVEHDYKAAMQAFLHARKIAINDSQRERIWSEFKIGLRHGYPDIEAASKQTASLIAKEKFAQLDQLGDQFRSSQAANADGLWNLDLFYSALDGGREFNETQYAQRVYELKRWLAQNPNSIAARIALAQCHIYNSWNARNQEGREDLFRDRLKLARTTMDADPDIIKKCPMASVVYVRLAVGESGDKEKFLKIAADCHKRYPTFFCIDTWVCYFLMPQWYGTRLEVEQYIKSRADEISGARGDKVYAQLVWYEQDGLENIFTENSPIRWQRVKSGFKQIFIDFPHDADARIAFMEMAFKANDEASIASALAGYSPAIASNKP
jgi:tetratricopeptide (TPR) repeat protein